MNLCRGYALSCDYRPLVPVSCLDQPVELASASRQHLPTALLGEGTGRACSSSTQIPRWLIEEKRWTARPPELCGGRRAEPSHGHTRNASALRPAPWAVASGAL